jgi:very-short-patch-repair endonuclease
VDFWFPDQGVVVEVDGRAKYEDPVMLDGRSTADVHWREKRREDFIRSCPGVRAVIRLSWSDLMQPDRVRAALRRAGVPCG